MECRISLWRCRKNASLPNLVILAIYLGLTFFLPKSTKFFFLWTKITLGEDRRGAAVVATLSMELSAPPSFPASPSSPLLTSRVRVFKAIPNPTPPPFQASIFSRIPRKLTPMDLPRNVSCAAVAGDNNSATTTLPIDSGQCNPLFPIITF